ncbi:hypothetical protein PIROE2DRAFT_61480 [Piromyces sp. E2]|nr:hypothetical protein PIROE2DRAFT_61480 [Piromyces sp. E2]|eukprot:OUM63088.1 hypothetical protein PIROE2DRAFT_61480 [Piromyces sp. E2]
MVNPRPHPKLTIITDYETLEYLIRQNSKRRHKNKSIKFNTTQQCYENYLKSTSKKTYCSPKGIVSLNCNSRDNSFYSTNMSLISTPGSENKKQSPVTFVFNENPQDKKSVITKVNGNEIMMNSYAENISYNKVPSEQYIQPQSQDNMQTVVHKLEQKADRINSREHHMKIMNSFNQKIKHSTSYSDLLKKKNKSRKEKTKTWCVVNSNKSDNSQSSIEYKMNETDLKNEKEPPSLPPPPPPVENYSTKKNRNINNITVDVSSTATNADNSQSFIIASAFSDKNYSSPQRKSSLLLSPYFHIQNQLAYLIQSEEKLKQELLKNNMLDSSSSGNNSMNNDTTTNNTIMDTTKFNNEMNNLTNYMINMNMNSSNDYYNSTYNNLKNNMYAVPSNTVEINNFINPIQSIMNTKNDDSTEEKLNSSCIFDINTSIVRSQPTTPSNNVNNLLFSPMAPISIAPLIPEKIIPSQDSKTPNNLILVPDDSHINFANTSDLILLSPSVLKSISKTGEEEEKEREDSSDDSSDEDSSDDSSSDEDDDSYYGLINKSELCRRINNKIITDEMIINEVLAEEKMNGEDISKDSFIIKDLMEEFKKEKQSENKESPRIEKLIKDKENQEEMSLTKELSDNETCFDGETEKDVKDVKSNEKNVIETAKPEIKITFDNKEYSPVPPENEKSNSKNNSQELFIETSFLQYTDKKGRPFSLDLSACLADHLQSLANTNDKRSSYSINISINIEKKDNIISNIDIKTPNGVNKAFEEIKEGPSIMVDNYPNEEEEEEEEVKVVDASEIIDDISIKKIDEIKVNQVDIIEPEVNEKSCMVEIFNQSSLYDDSKINSFNEKEKGHKENFTSVPNIENDDSSKENQESTVAVANYDSREIDPKLISVRRSSLDIHNFIFNCANGQVLRKEEEESSNNDDEESTKEEEKEKEEKESPKKEEEEASVENDSVNYEVFISKRKSSLKASHMRSRSVHMDGIVDSNYKINEKLLSKRNSSLNIVNRPRSRSVTPLSSTSSTISGGHSSNSSSVNSYSSSVNSYRQGYRKASDPGRRPFTRNSSYNAYSVSPQPPSSTNSVQLSQYSPQPTPQYTPQSVQQPVQHYIQQYAPQPVPQTVQQYSLPPVQQQQQQQHPHPQQYPSQYIPLNTVQNQNQNQNQNERVIQHTRYNSYSNPSMAPPPYYRINNTTGENYSSNVNNNNNKLFMEKVTSSPLVPINTNEMKRNSVPVKKNTHRRNKSLKNLFNIFSATEKKNRKMASDSCLNDKLSSEFKKYQVPSRISMRPIFNQPIMGTPPPPPPPPSMNSTTTTTTTPPMNNTSSVNNTPLIGGNTSSVNNTPSLNNSPSILPSLDTTPTIKSPKNRYSIATSSPTQLRHPINNESGKNHQNTFINKNRYSIAVVNPSVNMKRSPLNANTTMGSKHSPKLVSKGSPKGSPIASPKGSPDSPSKRFSVANIDPNATVSKNSINTANTNVNAIPHKPIIKMNAKSNVSITTTKPVRKEKNRLSVIVASPSEPMVPTNILKSRNSIAVSSIKNMNKERIQNNAAAAAATTTTVTKETHQITNQNENQQSIPTTTTGTTAANTKNDQTKNDSTMKLLSSIMPVNNSFMSPLTPYNYTPYTPYITPFLSYENTSVLYEDVVPPQCEDVHPIIPPSLANPKLTTTVLSPKNKSYPAYPLSNKNIRAVHRINSSTTATATTGNPSSNVEDRGNAVLREINRNGSRTISKRSSVINHEKIKANKKGKRRSFFARIF